MDAMQPIGAAPPRPRAGGRWRRSRSARRVGCAARNARSWSEPPPLRWAALSVRVRAAEDPRGYLCSSPAPIGCHGTAEPKPERKARWARAAGLAGFGRNRRCLLSKRPHAFESASISLGGRGRRSAARSWIAIRPGSRTVRPRAAGRRRRGRSARRGSPTAAAIRATIIVNQRRFPRVLRDGGGEAGAQHASDASSGTARLGSKRRHCAGPPCASACARQNIRGEIT